MKKIGVLSDTHGILNPGVLAFFDGVDEIWHAGDIGDEAIVDQLSAVRTLRAVHGNIDDHKVRIRCPENLVFTVEDVRVAMTHIGGYPGRYDRRAAALIRAGRPDVFVCGHSHILKVMYDRKNECLTLNPGAAGNFGIHRSVTAIRFVINGKEIKEMEILDLPRK